MSTLNDTTIIITGATNGIGQVAATELARMGARVVLVGRDAQKSAAVAQAITAQTGNPAVDVLLADLSSQAEVRRLAGEILARYPRIDVLLNNAGAVFGSRQLTVDGIERTFALNHLAYFQLTNLLLERIKASAPARIVNVSSAAHSGATLDFDDLQGQRRYSAFGAYSKSKLANLLFTYELARRLAGSGVTVNAVHPGPVATGFGRNNGGLWGVVFRLIAPLMRTPAQGAATSIYVASSPELAGVSGKYFSDSKAVESSRASHAAAAAARLWQVSAEMTGLPAAGA